jgi:hypothetical protein
VLTTCLIHDWNKSIGLFVYAPWTFVAFITLERLKSAHVSQAIPISELLLAFLACVIRLRVVSKCE